MSCRFPALKCHFVLRVFSVRPVQVGERELRGWRRLLQWPLRGTTHGRRAALRQLASLLPVHLRLPVRRWARVWCKLQLLLPILGRLYSNHGLLRTRVCMPRGNRVYLQTLPEKLDYHHCATNSSVAHIYPSYLYYCRKTFCSNWMDNSILLLVR